MNRSDILIPETWKNTGALVAGFTTRRGGTSKGPFDSMNLGLSTDDDPASVQANRARLAEWAGIEPGRMAIAGQIHSDHVKMVESPGLYPGFDALVTADRDIMLCITAADCAVVLLADVEAGVIAACHAGWRGTVAGIVPKSVRMMRDLGASSIQAYVSPCISAAEFEVGEDVAAKFEDRHVLRSEKWPRPHVDMKSALSDQLTEAGITQVEVSDRCTYDETADFFSHRAENGVTGRMMGFILLR